MNTRGLHVLRYPTGRYGFVGSVPTMLAFAGTFNLDDTRNAFQSGPRIARVIAESHGRTMETRTWPTAEAARAAALAAGFPVSEA